MSFWKISKLARCVPQVDLFLWFAPLYVGIIILTFYFTMTAVMSVLVNIQWLYSQVSIACLLIYVFNVFILITWLVGILGVMKKEPSHAKLALYLWSAFIVVWVSVVLCSAFSAYGKSILCLECRCPESFWIYNNTWHTIRDEHQIVLKPVVLGGDKSKDHRNHNDKSAKSLDVLNDGRIKRAVDIKPNHGSDNENKTKTTENIKMLLITTAVNAGILLFSWLVLFNNHRIEENKKPKKTNKRIVFKNTKNSCACA